MTTPSASGTEARRRPTVAILGDASLKVGSPKEVLAEQLGAAIINAGYRLVTGGRRGVMEAASRGARNADGWEDGRIIAILPGFDPADANDHVDVAIPTGLDFMRNAVVATSDAVIAIGGGAGTLSEVCYAWIYQRLILAARDVDGWSARIADTQLDHRVRYPQMPDDKVFGISSAAEAIALINERLPRYDHRHRGKGSLVGPAIDEQPN